MTIEIREWKKEVYLHTVCAPKELFEFKLQNDLTRFEYVTGIVYPLLLKTGYELPLSVVVDLTCLYLDSSKKKFGAPSSLRIDSFLLMQYCMNLNQDASRGPLRKVIKAAQNAIHHNERFRASPREPNMQNKQMQQRHGEIVETKGLMTFLEMVSIELLRKYDLIDRFKRISLPSVIHKQLLQADIKESYLRNRFATQISDVLTTFLEALFVNHNEQGIDRVHNRDGSDSLSQPFHKQEHRLLTITSAHIASGAEGIDLHLLQECMNYKPLDLPISYATRYQRLCQTLSPKQLRSIRSPECGNHGVTTKGNPTAVLRSYLARDDFIERLYMGQVLYFDRYAPQYEPQKVLIAWTVDRGLKMQRRTSLSQNLCLDTIARQLVAYLIEDTVRHFVHIPALNLQIAVVLHNGGRNGTPKALSGRMIVPLPEILIQAPKMNINKKKNDTDVWLPKVNSFLPHYFLRTPLWFPDDIEVRNFNRLASQANSAFRTYRQAIAAMMGNLRFSNTNRDHDHSWHPYDLLHVFIIGMAEDLPVCETQELHDSLRFMRSYAGRSGLSCIAFDEQTVELKSYPSLMKFENNSCKESHHECLRSNSQIRLRAWEDLFERLHNL